MQKLPRLLETDPHNINNFQILKESSHLFFPQGKVKVPQVELSENLIRTLAFARRCGSLRGGLENIKTILQTEEAGLKALKSRGEIQGDNRISRLLIFTDDGTERFYRQCESLLIQFERRVFGIKINANSSFLGKTFFGKEKPVKAILVCRKDAVTKVLIAIMQAKQ